MFVVGDGYDPVAVVTEVSWEVSLSQKPHWRPEAIRQKAPQMFGN